LQHAKQALATAHPRGLSGGKPAGVGVFLLAPADHASHEET